MANGKLGEMIEFLRAHPGSHNQNLFVFGLEAALAASGSDDLADRALCCGTTACLAGWTVIRYAPDLMTEPLTGHREIRYDEVAARILDLTETEAAFLFYRARTLNQLERLAQVIEADPQAGYIQLSKALTQS